MPPAHVCRLARCARLVGGHDGCHPLGALLAARDPLSGDIFPDGSLKITQVLVGAGLARAYLFVVRAVLIALGTGGMRVAVGAEHPRTQIDRRAGAVPPAGSYHRAASWAFPDEVLRAIQTRELIQIAFQLIGQRR